MFFYYMFLLSLASFIRSDMPELEEQNNLFQKDEDVFMVYEQDHSQEELDGYTEADLACFEYREHFNSTDGLICQSYNADTIYYDEFPKAYKFLVNLIRKYPEEFKNVTFVKVKGTIPFAGCSVIGIPYQWLLDLESEIKVAEQWTEWALLHEAGHIHHQHVKFLTCLAVMKNVFYQCFTSGLVSLAVLHFISDETFKKSWGQECEKYHIVYAVLSFLSVAMATEIGTMLYSRFVAEPQADDFAVEKCKSKEALEGGIKFLDEVVLDNLSYPSVEDRIAKIKNAIESKHNN